MIEAYVQSLLDIVVASPIVSTFDVTLDKRTAHLGLIRGELRFLDDSRLHFRELVEVKGHVIRQMYSYHYQDAANTLLFRYDDTPHHPSLDTFPHHKHDRSEANVVEAVPPCLAEVLREIEAIHPLM